MTNRATITIAVALALGAQSQAFADATPEADPVATVSPDTPAFRVELGRGVAIFSAVGWGLGASFFRLDSDHRATLDDLPFDRADIFLGLDRSVVGNRSRLADDISDIMLLATVVAPLGFAITDALVTHFSGSKRGVGIVSREIAIDIIVLGETFLLNTLLFEIAKTVAARPRPYTYLEDLGGYTANEDALRSFYSGHAATAFAGATSLSMLVVLKHKDTPIATKVSVFAASYVFAGTVATLRVVAGKHFWTDVLVGSAAGILVGAAIPLLHAAGGAWD